MSSVNNAGELYSAYKVDAVYLLIVHLITIYFL